MARVDAGRGSKIDVHLKTAPEPKKGINTIFNHLFNSPARVDNGLFLGIKLYPPNPNPLLIVST
jgi:hypothetical protein